MEQRAKLTNCDECPLHKLWGVSKVKISEGRRILKEVPYREVPFRGSKNATLLVVGESPGAEEVEQGKPFVGRSGKLSDKVLQESGIDLVSVFYANSCRCLLDKSSLTTTEMAKALECCRPAVLRTIEVLKPKLILCYGDIALRQILNIRGITKIRGRLIKSKEFNCWVIPTFHPSFCLRDLRNLTFFKPDIQQAANFLAEKIDPEGSEDLSSTDFREVDSIRFILDRTPKIVAIDTETQGLDWINPNSVVISYSISDSPSMGYNVQLLREIVDGETPDFTIEWPRRTGKKIEDTTIGVIKTTNYNEKIEELKELLRDGNIKKVMMNGNYDVHRLNQLGITEINGYKMDIQLAFHGLDPDMHKGASLLDIQRVLLPAMHDYKTEFTDSVDKNDLILLTKIAPEKLAKYAALDAVSTLGCSIRLNEEYRKYPHLSRYYSRLAHPVTTEVLFEIEKNGILFNSSGVENAKLEVAKEILKLEEKFAELVPGKIRDVHDKQGKKGSTGCVLTRRRFIQDVLFSDNGFGLTVLERTPSGDIAIGRKILERIREDLDTTSPAFQAITILNEWGPLRKLYSTYLTGFASAVKIDSRLHTHITKTMVATGRTSSSHPNLQNVPKRNKKVSTIIRSLMHADEGSCLVAADYSQQELRWIAQRSGDPEFIRVYNNNEDIHLRTALGLLGIDSIDKVSKEELALARRNAKSVNFGLAYGMLAKGFRNYAQDEYGLKLTIEEAEEYRRKYFLLYKGLPDWHKREVEEASKRGYCVSPFGFMRMVPNIKSDNFMKRIEDERIAINTPIQNAGSDTALLAALKAKKTGVIDPKIAKLVLFIHDELIFEVKENYVDKFAKDLSDVMESIDEEILIDFGLKMRIPLKADVKVGYNLAEMHEL